MTTKEPKKPKVERLLPAATTKNELVTQLRNTMNPDIFTVFAIACVSEDVYEGLSNTSEFTSAAEQTRNSYIREVVHKWWSLPNTNTIHTYTIEEKKE